MSEKELGLSFDEHLMQKERKQRNLKMKKEKQRIEIRTPKKGIKKKHKHSFKNLPYDIDDDEWYND